MRDAQATLGDWLQLRCRRMQTEGRSVSGLTVKLHHVSSHHSQEDDALPRDRALIRYISEAHRPQWAPAVVHCVPHRVEHERSPSHLPALRTPLPPSQSPYLRSSPYHPIMKVGYNFSRGGYFPSKACLSLFVLFLFCSVLFYHTPLLLRYFLVYALRLRVIISYRTEFCGLWLLLRSHLVLEGFSISILLASLLALYVV